MVADIGRQDQTTEVGTVRETKITWNEVPLIVQSACLEALQGKGDFMPISIVVSGDPQKDAFYRIHGQTNKNIGFEVKIHAREGKVEGPSLVEVKDV